MSQLPNVSRILPKLHFGQRKGACGRIGIVGGSADYTGAPYFSAITALKLGADLVHVFCPAEAAPVIKGYSPELMVHPDFEDEKRLLENLGRLDAIVLGPGLGRDPRRRALVQSVLSFAQQKQLPTVIDADGLWFLCDLLDVFRGASTFFLTPNIIEFHRLVGKATGSSDLDRYNKDPVYIREKGLEFVQTTGLSIYVKAKEDLVIAPGWTEPVYGLEEGIPRRCGGQGDLTSGALGIFYFWAKRQFESPEEAIRVAGLAAHEIVRQAARDGYSKFGRSITATDMIEQLCPILMELDSV